MNAYFMKMLQISTLQKIVLVAGGMLSCGCCSVPMIAQAHPALLADPSLASIQQQIDRGHAAEALVELHKLAVEKPMPAGVDLLRGKALYAQNRFIDAAAAFRLAHAENSKDSEAAQLLGLTLFRLGRPADAIPLLESAPEMSADSKVDPSYILALCYLDGRRYDDARHAFAKQYGFAGDSAQAYLLAARMLLRREYVPVAQTFARKSLELDPQLPLAHGLLGEVALAGEHLDEAISEFEKEKARNPLDGGVYDRLGDAYARKGDYLLAQESLQRALLLEPNSTGPYILLGKVLIKRGDPASARTYLERAVGMDPGNYMSHNLLGQVYRALGRADDAARELGMSQKIQAASEPKLEVVK